jgi:hypothetical protein
MPEFYRCDICHMYHRVGFEAKRDAALVIKEIGGIKRLVEPPPFVWREEPHRHCWHDQQATTCEAAARHSPDPSWHDGILRTIRDHLDGDGPWSNPAVDAVILPDWSNPEKRIWPPYENINGHVAAVPSSVMNSRRLARNSIRKRFGINGAPVSSTPVRSAHGNSLDHLVGE